MQRRPDGISDEDWAAIVRAMRDDDDAPAPPRRAGLLTADDADYASDDDDDGDLDRGPVLRARQAAAAPRRVPKGSRGGAGQRGARARAGARRGDGDGARVDRAEADSEHRRFGVALAQRPSAEQTALAIAAVRERSREHEDIGLKDAAELLSHAVGYLAWTYREELGRGGVRVSLVPESKALHCVAELRHIHVGARLVADIRDGDTSAYRAERAPLERHVRDKEGFLLWFAVHEFCHALIPREGHSGKFFQRVESIASECPFFFA
eukprot:m51a1_g5099 hypothetical protein (266) ;mRNA; f:295544-296478